MQTPDSLPTGTEKWLKWLLLAGLGAGIFYFWGSISSFVKQTIWDTWNVILYGGPLVLLLLFCWQYPDFVAMTYRNMCKYVQAAFIKSDPLSYMDRYADLLVKKLNNLGKNKRAIKAELVATDQQIETDKKTWQDNLGWAKAAKQEGDIETAASYAMEAKNAEDSIKQAMPGREKLAMSIEFMTKLEKNWAISIKGIRSFNDRKRRDYKTLKRQAHALNQSQEFLKGETPAAQLYNQSIQIANEQMATWRAYVEDFEERAAPILKKGDIEARAQQNAGLDLLDEYMKNDKLMLPDFNNLGKVGQYAEYELLSSTPKKESANSKEFGL